MLGPPPSRGGDLELEGGVMCPCENMAQYMEHLLGLASECRCQINRRYKTFVGTLHCALENGADLYVNERQKIRHSRARSAEDRRRRRMPNRDLFRAVRIIRFLLSWYKTACVRWKLSLSESFCVSNGVRQVSFSFFVCCVFVWFAI